MGGGGGGSTVESRCIIHDPAGLKRRDGVVVILLIVVTSVAAPIRTWSRSTRNERRRDQKTIRIPVVAVLVGINVLESRGIVSITACSHMEEPSLDGANLLFSGRGDRGQERVLRLEGGDHLGGKLIALVDFGCLQELVGGQRGKR